MRRTRFRATDRKQEAPWLARNDYGPKDTDATVSFSEFRDQAANHRTRQLGRVRRSEDLHKTAQCDPLRVQQKHRNFERKEISFVAPVGPAAKTQVR